jgi:hypothetical protein
MEKVEMITESGCWIWMGDIFTQTGYALYSPSEEERKIRRYWTGHVRAYELFRGPVPKGLHLDHLCRVRCCVNPWHLEAVTQKVNNERAAKARIANHSKCAHEHELSGDNLLVMHSGRRACRACAAERIRRFYERKRLRKTRQNILEKNVV